MADFNVSIRSSYRDIARLCLDLRPGDYELTTDRKVLKWINKAPPAWSSGGMRFGNAAMATHSRRPVPGDGGAVRFLNSQTHGLDVPLNVASGLSQAWTFALDIVPGDSTPKQAVLDSVSGGFSVWRISSSGVDHGYQTSAGEVTASGEMLEGSYVLAFEGGGLADLIFDNAAQISDGAAANIQFPASTTQSLRIGYSSVGDYFDGQLRGVKVWNRVLSLKERDFVFQTLGLTDTSAGVSGVARADVDVRAWVDGTGDLSLRQTRRVNPLGGRHQKFRCATSGDSVAIVQLACETSGDVLADASLGGDLYALSCIERSSSVDPTVTQDSGWSSIFDVRVDTSGHYTFLIERPNHGAVYVHLDVELG